MKTFIKIFGLWLAVFLVGKVAFMTFCHGTESLSLADACAVLWHGLPMDLSTTVYLVALPGLCLWLTAFVPAAWKVVRVVLTVYHAIAALAVMSCLVGDIALFPFWGFKLDATIWTYIDSPADAMASVSVAFVILHILSAILGTALITWATHRILAQHKLRHHHWSWNLAYALLAVFLFIVLRGGITESTMNVGHAYFSDRQFLNHAAVNPAFSLLASTQKAEDFDQLYRSMPDDEVDALLQDLYPISSDHEAQAVDAGLLRSQRPNILLIFWEGCGGWFTDALGHHPGITPHLDSLFREGIFFDQFYANSFRTDRGTLCTLSGHLPYPTHSLMKMAARASHLPSMARTLSKAGYQTSFTYGGDINFTNMKGYLLSTGFERITANTDFSHADRQTAKWGVADSILCEYLYQQITTDQEPFFHAALTLSSHQPWDVPGYDENEGLWEQMNRSFRYTDACLGRLVERLRQTPQWDNLLVIFLPDHGIFTQDRQSDYDPRLYHIPMVWVGGAVTSPAHITTLMNQSDLPATLFGQMQLPHADFPWSRDVLSPNYTYPFTYSSFVDGFALVDSVGPLVWDNIGARLTEETDARARLGLAIQQRSYDQLNELAITSASAQ